MPSVLKTSTLLAAVAGLTLAGCNAPTTEIEPEMTSKVVMFQCPGGEVIEAQFDNPEQAIVTLPDQAPLTLPIAESASGARYSDGTTTFWNKGSEAMVEVNGETTLSGCMAQE